MKEELHIPRSSPHAPLPSKQLLIDSLYSLTVSCALPPSTQLLKSSHLIASIQLRIPEGIRGILSMGASKQESIFIAKISLFDTLLGLFT
jgi:hypothetical protein